MPPGILRKSPNPNRAIDRKLIMERNSDPLTQQNLDFDIVFPLKKWPRPTATAVFSLQWLVILVPGLLVMGGLVASAQGLAPPQQVEFLQRLLLMCAVVQIGQVLSGHRLPGLVGPSAVLMVGVLGSLEAGLPAVYGAMAVGGALTAILGFTGLAARLGRIFTPPILATTLILISVTLAPSVRDLVFHPATKGGGGGSFLFAMAVVLATFWVQHHLKGLWSSASVLLGMMAGAFAYHIFGLGLVESQTLGAGPFFSLPTLIPRNITFRPAVIAVFVVFYLAVISNELATVKTLGGLLKAPDMKGRCNRTVMAGGLGGLLAALMGVPGPVTYSVSPGVVIASKSASRLTLLPAAGLLILLALWPRGLALFSLVPPPVVGAVLFFLLASTVYAALLILMTNTGSDSWNAGIVVGASMVAGLLVTFMPERAKEGLPALLQPLLANGFVVGLVMALLLEHVILRRK